MNEFESQIIRTAAFEWLDSMTFGQDYILDWQHLTKGFRYQGSIIPLIGAKGIWKPKLIDKYPISITSVLKSDYPDKIIDDETLHYSYRGNDPMHPDNVGLRNAMLDQVPLVYFHQVLKGKYFVAWPVFIVNDEPGMLRFTVSAESHQSINDSNIVTDPEAVYRRKYQTRQVLIRLHQQSFRERVLMAYREHCAVCNLKHRVLLDAAHIIPDSQGDPLVSNGLSLCKIHHAAYDQNIIGINPDYNIEVRNDILEEVDGPMLKYGLQEMNGNKILVPRSKLNQPNRNSLDIRYQQFKRA